MFLHLPHCLSIWYIHFVAPIIPTNCTHFNADEKTMIKSGSHWDTSLPISHVDGKRSSRSNQKQHFCFCCPPFSLQDGLYENCHGLELNGEKKRLKWPCPKVHHIKCLTGLSSYKRSPTWWNKSLAKLSNHHHKTPLSQMLFVWLLVFKCRTRCVPRKVENLENLFYVSTDNCCLRFPRISWKACLPWSCLMRRPSRSAMTARPWLSTSRSWVWCRGSRRTRVSRTCSAPRASAPPKVWMIWTNVVPSTRRWAWTLPNSGNKMNHYLFNSWPHDYKRRNFKVPIQWQNNFPNFFGLLIMSELF